jgi:DNA (cytosine-5)-methyltransferase 1
VITEKSKVRILTPKEAWRLMGLCRMNEDGTFNDTNFERAAEQVSSAQLYKQAGNSIVVDVLVHLYLSFLAPENKGSQTLIDQWGRKE